MKETGTNIRVFPAHDVPGQWVAHCLDFDIVTCGNSREHAMEMLQDAIDIVVADDVEHGLDPRRRRAGMT